MLKKQLVQSKFKHQMKQLYFLNYLFKSKWKTNPLQRLHLDTKRFPSQVESLRRSSRDCRKKRRDFSGQKSNLNYNHLFSFLLFYHLGIQLFSHLFLNFSCDTLFHNKIFMQAWWGISLELFLQSTYVFLGAVLS